VLNSFVMGEESCWTLFDNGGGDEKRSTCGIDRHLRGCRSAGTGTGVTESKTVSCISMPFIGYKWYNMNVFASGNDVADSTQFGGFWWSETEKWDSVRVSFLFFRWKFERLRFWDCGNWGVFKQTKACSKHVQTIGRTKSQLKTKEPYISEI